MTPWPKFEPRPYGGLVVSMLDSGSRSLGLSPGRVICVVFLGKNIIVGGAVA